MSLKKVKMEMLRSLCCKVVMLAFIAMILGFSANCSSTPRIEQVNGKVLEIIKEAEALAEKGKLEEAAAMLQSLEELHPNDPRVQAVMNKLSAEQKEAVGSHPWLGFNKARRAKVQATTMERVLWYIPDRIMDYIDMVTLEINVGAQLGFGVWLTRAVQVVLFTGSTAGIGYYQKKQLGARVEASAEIGLGPIVASAVAGYRAGTGGLDGTARGLVFHRPSHPLYQEYRDYWALGTKFGFVFIGAEFELHPVEIFDFLAGIILFDPMNDDLATTRRLRFDDYQSDLMKEILKMRGKMEPEDLKNYKAKFPSLGGETKTTPVKTEKVEEKKAPEKKEEKGGKAPKTEKKAKR